MDLYRVLKEAYNFGRDNGSGRSDKNLNDFIEKPEIKQLLIHSVVKSLPSKEAMTNEIKTQTDVGDTKDDLTYKSIFADGFKQCYYWLRHELTK